MFEFLIIFLMLVSVIFLYEIEKRFRALGQFLVEWQTEWEESKQFLADWRSERTESKDAGEEDETF